jgi:hypothetical protein
MFKQHCWTLPEKKILKAKVRSKKIAPELSGYGDDDDNFGFSLKMPKIKFKTPRVTIKKIVPKITINTKTPLKTLSNAAGDAWRIANPVNQMHSIVDKVPMLKQIHKETDNVLGGTLSKLDRISNMPYKALKGKPISKGEIMEALVTAIQVAAIVASGGSAAALIAAGASMLKQGPLGQTSFGRNVLTLCEIAGVAAAISSTAATQIAAQSAGSTVATQAAGQAAKMTVAEAAQKAVTDHVVNRVKSEVEKEFEKKTGIPVGIVTKIYNVANGDGKIATLPKDIAKDVAQSALKRSGISPDISNALMEGKVPEMSKVARDIASKELKKVGLGEEVTNSILEGKTPDMHKIAEERLKKAGLGDTITQAILSNNASQLGLLITNAPNLALTKAERELKAQSLKAEKYLSVEGLRKIAKEKADKAVAEATDLEKLKAKLDAAVDKAIKAELQKQFDKALSSFAKNQKEAVDAGSEAELEGARASVLIAAAEEGRYEEQPSTSYTKWIIGGAVALGAGLFAIKEFSE